MDRRQAIEKMVLISSGIALLPACQFESVPVYEHIPLEKDQWQLINQLTEAILPKGELEIVTPENTSHFVLTMINDCDAPEDIEKYISGMQAFQQNIRDEHKTAFDRLSPDQQVAFLNKLVESKETPENLSYFLNSTKRLTVRHFTSSEYFMKNYLDFQFIPEPYQGCVPV